MTNVEINRAVEAHLRKLIRYQPKCCLGNDGGSGATNPSTRLAELVEMGTNGGVLRHCETKHLKVLASRFASMVFDARISDDWDQRSPIRRPTAREAVRQLGLSYDQYRRCMTEARELVRRAMEEDGRARVAA